MSAPSYRLRCRLRRSGIPKPEEALSRLAPLGWTVERGVAEKDGSLVRSLGPSLDGWEFMFTARILDIRHLEELIGTIIQDCWYIDLYLHLKGSDAHRVAELLGVDPGKKREYRSKMFGILLKVSCYPSADALTIAYRIGWSEASKEIASKIHRRIFGKTGSSILSRVLRWRR